MATVHLLIKGDVQGVFYRATAKEMADKFGVKGWIKNTRDGNVEAMVTANEGSIKEFIDWCKKGPPKATVEDVVVTPKEDSEFKDFSVIRGIS